MLGFILISITITFVIAIVMSLQYNKKSTDATTEKFTSAGYTVTKQDSQILIDEKNQKWICTQSADMPILDFSDITDVELVEDGIKYKSENGVFRAVTGGVLFGAAGAIVGASTAKKSRKATQIYVLIYTKNLSYQTIRIYTFNRPLAEKLVGTVNAMCALAGTDKTSEKADLSAADEITKYKSLLDSGTITQEEFNAKKKQLLGL